LPELLGRGHQRRVTARILRHPAHLRPLRYYRLQRPMKRCRVTQVARPPG
jgi:hypothetical protein